LVRVAGIVQVAKSSESSADVIPATSSRRGPVSINRRTMAPKGWQLGARQPLQSSPFARFGTALEREVSNLFAYRFVDALCGLFPSP
jgi:hypothetical protein